MATGVPRMRDGWGRQAATPTSPASSEGRAKCEKLPGCFVDHKEDVPVSVGSDFLHVGEVGFMSASQGCNRLRGNMAILRH